MLLNIGVVVLPEIALPYYIIRSRDKGQKGKAVLKLIGFVGLTFVSGVFGGILGSFVG
jgi:hypothetical protein